MMDDPAFSRRPPPLATTTPDGGTDTTWPPGWPGKPSSSPVPAAAPSPSSWLARRGWGAGASGGAVTPGTPASTGSPGGGAAASTYPAWPGPSPSGRVGAWTRQPPPPPPPPYPPSAFDLAGHAASLSAAASSAASSALAAVRAARSAALLAGSALGGGACLAGWVLLLGLLATRALAPPAAVVSRELWVDYTASPASGVASFLPDPAAAALVAAAAGGDPKGGGAAPSSLLPRAFPAGRRLDVWLTVEAPDVDARGGGGGAAGDVFQVRAELLAPDGRVLAAASRPALLPPRSRAARALRSAALAPLVVLGLADELRSLRVPLFTAYRDRGDAPFVALRVALAGRASAGGSAGAVAINAPPPALAAVRGVVRQRLPLPVRLLYWVRPGDALAWPLFALAAVAIAGGGAAAALCALGWVLSSRGWLWGGASDEGGEEGEEDGGLSVQELPSGAATPGRDYPTEEDDWAAAAPRPPPSVVISSSSSESEGEAGGMDGGGDSGRASASSDEFVDSLDGGPEGDTIPAAGVPDARWEGSGGGLRWRGGGGSGG